MLLGTLPGSNGVLSSAWFGEVGLASMSIAADGDWSASSNGRVEGTIILGDRTDAGLEMTVMSALQIGH